MPISRIIIKNYKSIKKCDISLSELNVLIGENGSGKSNILEAIDYFYRNLTRTEMREDIFDVNNRFSNEVNIAIEYDFKKIVDASDEKIQRQSALERTFIIDLNGYQEYVQSVNAMAKNSINNIIRVELSQVKKKKIQWNISYKERMIIKSLFPLFMIDTRNFDINEWKNVWEVLGEITKVSNNENEVILNEMRSVLDDPSKGSSEKMKVIKEVLNQTDVNIKSASAKELALFFSKHYLSGEIIRQKGRNLGYYSAGTNSIKYLEVLLKAINSLPKVKMKEPLILLDEPEISLHTSFLDKLAEYLTDLEILSRIIVSTHSPRLTKQLIIKKDKLALFRTKLQLGHTEVFRMNKFPLYNPKAKYRVTDEHINAYFSRANLFVEGESELELFLNPFLHKIFPKLSQVDIFKAVSDKPVLKIMNPKLVNSQIPFIILIDRDKAICTDASCGKFKKYKEFFPNNKQEKYQICKKGSHKELLLWQRKRIDAMTEKLTFGSDGLLLSSGDNYFETYKKLIDEYLFHYKVFCFDTTLEGSLINTNTKHITMDFLSQRAKTKEEKSKIQMLKSYLDEKTSLEQTSILRMIFGGKTDFLMTKNQLLKMHENKSSEYFLEERLEKILKFDFGVGKSSGWISEYLDYYFQRKAELEQNQSEHISFGNEKSKKIIEEFSDNFPELFLLITKLCEMIS